MCLVALAGYSNATACAVDPVTAIMHDVPAAFERATVVFIGKAQRVSRRRGWDQKTAIKVLEQFKGERLKLTVQMTNVPGIPCSDDINEGRTYLFFVHRIDAGVIRMSSSFVIIDRVPESELQRLRELMEPSR